MVGEMGRHIDALFGFLRVYKNFVVISTRIYNENK